jgi:hypothetical protein
LQGLSRHDSNRFRSAWITSDACFAYAQCNNDRDAYQNADAACFGNGNSNDNADTYSNRSRLHDGATKTKIIRAI